MPDAQNVLDTSVQSNDLSWVDAHRFGTPSFKSSQLQQSPSPNKKSPSYSQVMSNVSVSDTSGILEDTKGGWKSPAVYGKSNESIHTRKQLDVLLRSNQDEIPVDMNTSTFSSIWSVFGLGRSGQISANNTWQVSEEITNDGNTNSCKLHLRSTISKKNCEIFKIFHYKIWLVWEILSPSLHQQTML